MLEEARSFANIHAKIKCWPGSNMWPYFHFSGKKETLKRLAKRHDGIAFSTCYTWDSIDSTPHSSQVFPRMFSLLCQLFSLKTNKHTTKHMNQRKKKKGGGGNKKKTPTTLALNHKKVRKIQAFYSAVLCAMDRLMQWDRIAANAYQLNSSVWQWRAFRKVVTTISEMFLSMVVIAKVETNC